MTTEAVVVTRDMEIAVQSEAEVARVSAQELAQSIECLEVRTANDYSTMGGLFNEARKRGNSLETKRKELTRPLDSLKKTWMEFFRPAEELLSKAKELAAQKMGVWTKEQECLRQERERMLREEEASRLRKQMKAAEKKAVKLEAKGLTEEAEAVRETVSVAAMPPVVAPTTVPKLEGLHTREDWDYEIVNPALLPREHLMPNDKSIRGVVKAMKGMTNIPGVRVFTRTGFVGRG